MVCYPIRGYCFRRKAAVEPLPAISIGLDNLKSGFLGSDMVSVHGPLCDTPLDGYNVANAMAELDAAGVALYSDQQALDSTSPFGKAMIQMACVFGELEREMIRARVVAGLNRVREQGGKLGRPTISRKVEDAIRQQLGFGHGILKVARLVGVGFWDSAAGQEGDGGLRTIGSN
jgi:hypothetical protein